MTPILRILRRTGGNKIVLVSCPPNFSSNHMISHLATSSTSNTVPPVNDLFIPLGTIQKASGRSNYYLTTFITRCGNGISISFSLNSLSISSLMSLLISSMTIRFLEKKYSLKSRDELPKVSNRTKGAG